jgi:hypothetical protein
MFIVQSVYILGGLRDIRRYFCVLSVAPSRKKWSTALSAYTLRYIIYSKTSFSRSRWEWVRVQICDSYLLLSFLSGVPAFWPTSRSLDLRVTCTAVETLYPCNSKNFMCIVTCVARVLARRSCAKLHSSRAFGLRRQASRLDRDRATVSDDVQTF